METNGLPAPDTICEYCGRELGCGSNCCAELWRVRRLVCIAQHEHNRAQYAAECAAIDALADAS
jgi:hypothetical protein